MKPSGIITLTTDFGRTDPYAGSVKGVILSINRKAVLVDISHDIPRGSVPEASWALMESHKYFPAGTVHLAVVDPGVGGDRRAIAAVSGGHFFVGPDNGILWPAIRDPGSVTVHLNNPRYFLPHVSSTFHGRDIFAPVAAWLSKGEDIRSMGVLVNDPVKVELQEPIISSGKLHGMIIRTDHFGNLITNLGRETVKGFLGTSPPVIRIGSIELTEISLTYSSVPEGGILALFGSSGCLEIAVNGGSAAGRLNPEDQEIIVEKRE
jgi:hypothetical protein